MRSNSPIPKKRPKPCVIRLVAENVPWIAVFAAVKESNVGEVEIREQFRLRRFGTADYVSPVALNHWIISGEVPAEHRKETAP